MDYGTTPAASYNWISIVVAVALPIVLIVSWIVTIHNQLVRLSNLINESWSNVDTELRRRYDLIPNLVNTVKAYAAHERDVFEQVTLARTKAMEMISNPSAVQMHENELVRTLKSLFAVAEAYPTLKADRNYLALQQELVDTEDRIQAARRFYNGNVRDYNTQIQSFPISMLAGAFGFTSRHYFEVEEAIAKALTSMKFGNPGGMIPGNH